MKKSDEKPTDTIDEIPVWPARNQTYRGFSTSICDLFRNRFDCCAFACCGFLMYDRSRFILTGEYPLSFRSRLFRYVVVPLLIFISAGFCAVHVKDPYVNEILSSVLILFMVLYLLNSCLSSRQERIAFRQEILHKIGRRGEQRSTDLEQAHGFCCGCYKVDGHYDQWEINENENNLTSNEDLCTRLWKCFARSCCGDRLNYFCQCCGICALAQESREIEKLVDRRETWIDFVTFEPFSSYFSEITKIRISRTNSPLAHYKATSKLSKMLLRSLMMIMMSLVLLSFLKFNTIFTYENVLVFAATFLQAFFTIYLVHWSVNKFELSLDAVIKYFTSGFLLTTGMAIVFETILSVSFQILLLIFATIFADSLNLNDASKQGESLLIRIGLTYPFIPIIYLFLYSYVLAAFVEEICKYFGYLMVQHPDLMIQESELLLDSSLEYEDPDDESAYKTESEDNKIAVLEKATNETDSSRLVAPPRNLNSIGKAITIAMVTVALGFACCENLMYIFVYTGGTIEEEFAVLLARSAFPIHPLAAAIQSIQVCRQTLEKDEKIKIGRIVAPAVILHGSFDFCLMVVNFLYELRDAQKNDDDDQETSMAGFAFKFGFGINVLAFVYYFWESTTQKQRLDELQRSMQALLA